MFVAFILQAYTTFTYLLFLISQVQLLHQADAVTPPSQRPSMADWLMGTMPRARKPSSRDRNGEENLHHQIYQLHPNAPWLPYPHLRRGQVTTLIVISKMWPV